jgi:hypothetical protein
MKVLHLPTAVGGNAWGLRNGERALGLESYCLTVDNGWLNYPSDFKVALGPETGRISRTLNLAGAFMKFRKGYDVYHFNFGMTLLNFPRFGLPLLDIPFYDSKAKIFATYNGCDARQKYPTIARTGISACRDDACYDGKCVSGAMDRYRRAMIKKMSAYASHIFALNPDLLYFLPPGSSFLPYSIAEWDNIGHVAFKRPARKLKIVHAPTDRAAKGTSHIIGAIERVKKARPDAVELTLVEGVSHVEALQMYASADLVIDQVLTGWYGGLAVEVMKMGKPVMCYIREDDLKFIPSQMRADLHEAIINVTPDTLFEALLEIADNRDILQEKSSAGAEYVRKWHDPVSIARIVKERYESADVVGV